VGNTHQPKPGQTRLGQALGHALRDDAFASNGFSEVCCSRDRAQVESENGNLCGSRATFRAGSRLVVFRAAILACWFEDSLGSHLEEFCLTKFRLGILAPEFAAEKKEVASGSVLALQSADSLEQRVVSRDHDPPYRLAQTLAGIV
jgi:hypothetical protein